MSVLIYLYLNKTWIIAGLAVVAWTFINVYWNDVLDIVENMFEGLDLEKYRDEKG